MEKEKIIQDFQYRTSRSSGPGGQHVNKVETKVEVLFHPESSAALTEAEKEWLAKRLAHRTRNDGMVVVSCQETRSQQKNRQLATQRMVELLENATKPPKIRRKLKPIAVDPETRRKYKRLHSAKKALRRKVDLP